MTRPCTTCLYGKRIHIAAHASERDRCFRPRMMTDGTFQESGRNGFDAEAERGVEPSPNRLPGDMCGPSGKHWVARP